MKRILSTLAIALLFTPFASALAASSKDSLLLGVFKGAAGQQDFVGMQEKYSALGEFLSRTLQKRVKVESSQNMANSLNNLREKRHMPFESSDLSSVRLTKGKLAIDLTRKTSDEWSAGHIVGADVALQKKLRSKDTVDSVVRALEALRIQTFLDGEKQPKTGDQLFFELRPKTGASVSWTLGPGNEGKREAWSKERNVAGEVPASDVEDLEKLLSTEAKKKG